jgi:hypothetical protein
MNQVSATVQTSSVTKSSAPVANTLHTTSTITVIVIDVVVAAAVDIAMIKNTVTDPHHREANITR